MKFLCGNCRTKYQIADEKVRGKILTIRCKKCGSQVVVRESLAKASRGKTVVAPLAAALTSSSAVPIKGNTEDNNPTAQYASKQDKTLLDEMPTRVAKASDEIVSAPISEWYVAIHGKQSGPFTWGEVKRQFEDGTLKPNYHVWNESMENWRRVDSIPEFFNAAVSPPAVALGFEENDATVLGVPVAALPIGAPGENSNEDTRDVGTKDLSEFEGEDLFARIPRADLSERMPRLSTKFFVHAAGVQNQRTRHRMGRVMGISIAAVSVLFLGLWMSGVIAISIPGMGNPFSRERNGDDLYDGDEVSGDGIKSAFLEKERKNKLRIKPRTSGQLIHEENTNLNSTALGPRGDETMTVGIGDSLSLEKARMEKIPESHLPESHPHTVEAPDTDVLTAEAIERVVTARKGSADSCYKQALKADEGLRGKVLVELVIIASGRVDRASVQNAPFKGTKFADCLVGKILGWRFPSFKGSPQTVIVPFSLERVSY